MQDEFLHQIKKTGFELVGIIPAKTPETYPAFEQYLENGYNAAMTYLAEKREARRHPASILPGVQSVIMLGISYAAVLNSAPHPVKKLTGIADYARGIDYHDWIRRRFKILSSKHRELFPNGKCRGTVDTAPLLEKAFAAEAGLGFIGKNTLLITPQCGSQLFLASFLSTEPFDRTAAVSEKFEGCGDCKKCLEACPVGALVEPYVLDARKCLSYWTIEHRGNLPAEIAAKRGDRFFGCDVCQRVCPHNRHNPHLPSGTVNPFETDREILRTITAGSPVARSFSVLR